MSALNRKLVLPKFGFNTTLISGLSASISSLYILIKISGSLPNLPAITTCLLLPWLLHHCAPSNSATKSAATLSARPAAFLRCSQYTKPLTPTASSAEAAAPITVSAVLLRSIPSRIILPKPPAPTKAASVAVPIISTAAVRMPEIIAGSANGSSTRISFCQRDKPNAVAASLIEG